MIVLRSSYTGTADEVSALRPAHLEWLEGLIGGLEDEQRLRSDKGAEDLPGRLVEFHGAVADAIRQADGLRRALNRVHQALGSVAYREV